MRKQLTSNRKAELGDLAKWTVESYADSNLAVNLQGIAESLDIGIYYDDFSAEFDGLAVYHEGKFSIFIHKKAGVKQHRGRMRYTLAHELAHCIIPEHRLYMMHHGAMKKAKTDNQEDKTFEREAEHFASCLLMPEESFAAETEVKTFDLNLIRGIAKTFDVSLIAALNRYMVVGMVPIAMVHSEGGIVPHGRRVFFRSKCFPYERLNLEEGNALPPMSLAAELVEQGAETGWHERELKARVWFETGVQDANIPLNEGCVLTAGRDKVISVLWF